MVAYYRPQGAQRQASIVPEDAAILFVDTQNFNCHKNGAETKALLQKSSRDMEYFFERMGVTLPNWQKLQAACAEHKVQTIFTVIESLTLDGRERSLDYKISGFCVPKGSWDAQVLEEIRPRDNDILIPKGSSSVFISTNIAYILRCLGVKQLIICGCVTDQCVEHAVRDGCDSNFLITLVTDATATYSVDRQRASERAIAGYCRKRTTQEVIDEISSAARTT
ncbi:hypothetical protein WJX84_002878 [Apatococcus fuscideae]|uniref:Isochorismatase-like domain-containing protein n=1 Tax=Apatococcus fuscideae TaxID=2026836 RepID=A0AAW1S0X4_9CHLO